MTAAVLRRDPLFYTAVFGAWALFLLLRFGSHEYLGTPFESAGFERTKGGMSRLSLLRSSLAELQKNLQEKGAAEKPHILQNIGCAYYDLFKEIGDRLLLDSAFTYVYQSTLADPKVARFHYNFGRLFTEIGDQQRALQEYELALQNEPTHVLALSNAGTCTYFAFGRRTEAAAYFGRALAVDSLLPMCHLILGLIALDQKDSSLARLNFEKEIAADRIALERSRYPLTKESILYATSLGHRNLLTLYCVKFKDRGRARQHLDGFLRIEPDKGKREEAEKEFKKAWGKN